MHEPGRIIGGNAHAVDSADETSACSAEFGARLICWRDEFENGTVMADARGRECDSLGMRQKMPDAGFAIVIDDDTLMRLATSDLLRREFAFASVLTFSSVESARIVLGSNEANVALIGSTCLRNGAHDRIETLTTHIGCPIAILADRTDVSRAQQLMERGATAVIDRRVDQAAFCEAIGQVLLGRRFCTQIEALPSSNRHDLICLERQSRSLRPRQREVLSLIASGLRNRDIASTLGLSEATIKAHVQSTFLVLGVFNRTSAAIFANRLIEGGLL